MTTMLRAGAYLAVAILLGSCGTESTFAEPAATSNEPTPAPAGGLPEGWRWESYRDVEVGVPASWSYGSSGHMSDWCIAGKTPKRRSVDRPGPVRDIGCNQAAKSRSDRSTRVATTGSFVAFRPHGRGDQVPSGGDRELRHIGSVDLIVQAQRPLRAQILATARQVAVDSKGCPVSDPISEVRGLRPSDPTAVTEITGVESVAACRYSLPHSPDDQPVGPAGLESSLALQGDAARSAIAAVAAAPLGGGPDAPESCLPKVSYGDEAIVLRVRWSGGRASQLYLRYSSCDHNGIDDGVALRTLTEAAVHPFIGDANEVSSWSGGGKMAILRPGAELSGAQEKCRCPNP